MSTATVVAYANLLRDTRHLGARAASDLADWLAYLVVDGKSERTLYSYQREFLLYLSLAACVASVLAGHELALLGLVGAVAVGVRR